MTWVRIAKIGGPASRRDAAEPCATSPRPAYRLMTRTIHCPSCKVELTIPEEAGSRRLRCPKCATRFYPDGLPAGKSPSPASSFLATKAEPPRSPKAKADRSPSTKPKPKSPTPPGAVVAPPAADLRDLLDIPLVDDDPLRPSRPAGVADAASLFRDDPPAGRRKKAVAEAKREARRCPSCGSVVLSGMSLCERCGLDLDTGQRYDVFEESLDDAPPPMEIAGPPAMVLVIGVVALVAGLVLTVLSVKVLDGVGRLLLTPVCLFGAFAGLQFLRGKALKLMIVSLMLGGGVDLVALVILPIVMADEGVSSEPGVESETAEKPAPAAKLEPGSSDAIPMKPVYERMDKTKVAVGIGIFLMDAAMLIAIATPGVHHYFERRRHSLDQGFIQP